MASAKAKTINLLLYEGNLGGVISIEDSSWNSGELYSAPRASISDLLNTDACSKFGVYLLLSEDMVYVGQSSDLARRINQHTIGKDWWTSVVILTTKDDNLNRSDIDYLEYILIEKATNIGRLDCDNKKKGNAPKVDKFREVFLQQYLEEALFLMQLIGINVFQERKAKPKAPTSGTLIDTMSQTLATGKNVKKEAIEFARSKGIEIKKNSTYAMIQKEGSFFWANPLPKCLETDWTIILNDNKKMELLVLEIPAKTLTLQGDGNRGLHLRNDQNRIDLKLEKDSLIDKVSGLEFADYLVEKITYSQV